MAAATFFGPVAAGTLVQKYGWGVMMAAMGVFAFSGAIPTVSHTVMLILSFVLCKHAAALLLA